MYYYDWCLPIYLCACLTICRLDTICYFTGGSHVTTPCYTSYTIVKLCTRLHLLLIHLAVLFFSCCSHPMCTLLNILPPALDILDFPLLSYIPGSALYNSNDNQVSVIRAYTVTGWRHNKYDNNYLQCQLVMLQLYIHNIEQQGPLFIQLHSISSFLKILHFRISEL